MQKVTDFTIKRPEWGRGGPSGCLFDPQSSKKCCLGFHALAVGLMPEQISGKTSPAVLADEGLINDDDLPFRFLLKALSPTEGRSGHYDDSEAAQVLMALNDSQLGERITISYRDLAQVLPPLRSEADREDRIATIFLTQGVRVRFED